MKALFGRPAILLRRSHACTIDFVESPTGQGINGQQFAWSGIIRVANKRRIVFKNVADECLIDGTLERESQGTHKIIPKKCDAILSAGVVELVCHEAILLGRRFVGIELKDSYYRTALKNLEIVVAKAKQRRLL